MIWKVMKENTVSSKSRKNSRRLETCCLNLKKHCDLRKNNQLIISDIPKIQLTSNRKQGVLGGLSLMISKCLNGIRWQNTPDIAERYWVSNRKSTEIFNEPNFGGEIFPSVPKPFKIYCGRAPYYHLH